MRPEGKLKERRKKILLPAFKYYYTVIITDNITQSYYKISHEHHSSINPAAFVFIDSVKRMSYMIFDADVSVGIIAHESYHAIKRLQESIHDNMSEETFAYHLEYLVDEIFNFHIGI